MRLLYIIVPIHHHPSHVLTLHLSEHKYPAIFEGPKRLFDKQ